MVQATLFDSKGPNYKISKYPKPTMLGATMRDNKDRLAPNHYSNGGILQSYQKNNENFTGRYSKGKIKSDIPQL